MVRRGGFGTSVTPVSQFYFQQAFQQRSVRPGENGSLKGMAKWSSALARHRYLQDAEIVRFVAEQLKLEPTTADPRAINDKDPKKGIDAANQRLTDLRLPITEENTFIAATCGDKGIAFLKGNGPIGVRKNVPEAAPSPSHTQANAPRIAYR